MKRKEKGRWPRNSPLPKCGAVVALWNCWMQVRFHLLFWLGDFLQASVEGLSQSSSRSVLGVIRLVVVVWNLAGFI